MSIRSITWCASSLATIVWPSGARNASSAEKRWPFGRLPGPGNDHRTAFASLTMRSLPLPRSAISRPAPNRPLSGVGTRLGAGLPGVPVLLGDGAPAEGVVALALAPSATAAGRLLTPLVRSASVPPSAMARSAATTASSGGIGPRPPPFGCRGYVTRLLWTSVQDWSVYHRDLRPT